MRDTLLNGRYRVLSEPMPGWLGVAYDAVDVSRRTRVTLHGEVLVGRSRRKAAARRASQLERSRHASIPRVVDAFATEQEHYLVTEFVASESLLCVAARRGHFGEHDAMRLGVQLLDALDHLHTLSSPIVHGGVCPESLRIASDGRLLLVDTPVANDRRPRIRRIDLDRVFGSLPGFVAPEVRAGSGPSVACDVYAAAATIYFLATGAPPPDARERVAACRSGLRDPLLLASERNASVSEAVAVVLRDALALRSRVRPRSAAELRERIEAATRTFPTGPRRNTRRRARLDGVFAIAVGALLVALSFVALAVFPLVLGPRCRVPNSAAAIGNARTIGSAQAMYFSEHGRYGSFRELVAEELLDSAWRQRVVRDRYLFTVDVSHDGQHFSVWADPQDRSTWGTPDRYFFLDDTFVIRYNVAAPAGPDNAEIGR